MQKCAYNGRQRTHIGLLTCMQADIFLAFMQKTAIMMPPTGWAQQWHPYTLCISCDYMQRLAACVYSLQPLLNNFLCILEIDLTVQNNFSETTLTDNVFLVYCKYMVSIVRTPLIKQSSPLSSMGVHVFELAYSSAYMPTDQTYTEYVHCNTQNPNTSCYCITFNSSHTPMPQQENTSWKRWKKN